MVKKKKKVIDLWAYWVPTKATGRVIFTRGTSNGIRYFILWHDEPHYRKYPYTKEDLDSGELIIGKNIKLLYESKQLQK